MIQSTAAYDPTQKFEVKIFDVEYRAFEGDAWLARIYQPQGTGPFPAFLDVHGGAWQGGSRTDGEYIDQSLAASGILVAAIDFRVAPEHPYPGQVMDVNYGIRWWKANAGDYRGNVSKLGALGISSGGHTAMLCAMRPTDKRYSSLPLPQAYFERQARNFDATLDYFVGVSPVLDPYARYLYARESGQERLVNGSLGYFLTEEAMREASPQLILERDERVNLPPALVIHGTADTNVPNYIPTRFAEAYRAAGGSIELRLFPDMPHSFVRTPGPETDDAIGMMKDFIARQLAC